MQDSFTVRYDMSYKETVASALYTISRLKVLRGLVTFLLVILLLLSVLTGFIGFLLNVGALLSVTIVFFLMLLARAYFTRKRNARQYKNLTFDFTHWGMTVTGGIDFSSQWHKILAVKETRLFFVFFSQYNVHFFIQKRMFRDEAECMAFREFLRAKMHG